VACTALVALAASTATPLHAAEPMIGRWAANPSGCAGSGGSGQALLVVTRQALRWSGELCRIGAQYRTGDTLHLEAFCSHHTGKHGIPVSLRLRGGHIFVTWDRAPRGELQKCR
jgi:hypothetical protein